MLPTVSTRPPRIADDIAQGARLAKMHGSDITPIEVVRVLDANKIAYVLVGGHAANGYTGQPRTTVDVDVIVRFPKKATSALLKEFPHLTAHDTPVVTRLLREGGDSAIDVMKPNTTPLWSRLLKISRVVHIGPTAVRVPPVEGVLAAKLAAMVSPHRNMGRKMIDGGDFIHIVQANEQIDLKLLEDLGELVYAGGGKEMLKHLADARAGRRIEI